jgi:membrane-associated phospholipid phosphatase
MLHDPTHLYEGELPPEKRKVARAISAVTYPPFMGIVAMVAIALCLAEGDMVYWTMGLGLLFATVLPLVLALLFSKLVGNGEGDIEDGRKRVVPMAVINLSYAAGAVAFHLIDAPDAAFLSMVAYLVNTTFCMVVSLKWKISLHAMGVVGPATALTISIWPWGLAVFLILPLVCWSRYYLRKHTPLQLALGALFGTLLTALVFFLL